MQQTYLTRSLIVALSTIVATTQAQEARPAELSQPLSISDAGVSTKTVILNPITIMGSASNAIDNTLPKVDIVNLNTLRNPRITNLKGAVTNDPAVEINSSGSGQAQALFIRGMGANYAELTLDGQEVPVYFTFGPYTSGGRDFVETDTLKQIDIVKGLVSPKQKSGALAGTVNMQSYNPSDFVDQDNPHYFGFKSDYTSKNKGIGGSLTLAGASNNLSGMLIYTHRRYHEQDNMGSDASRTLHDKQDITQHNILAKAEMALNSGNVLLTAERFKRDHTTYPRYPNPRNPRAAASTEQPTSRTRLALTGEFYNTMGLDKLSAELSKRQFKQTTERFGTSDYKQDNIGFKLDADKRFHVGAIEHNLLFGLAYEYYKHDYIFQFRPRVNGRYLPLTEKNKISAYFKDSVVLDNGFTVSPGVRIEHQRLSSKPDALYQSNPALRAHPNYVPQGHSTTISPSVNAMMPIGNHWKLFASYAKGFKQADEGNIASYDHGFGYIIPNPDLKTEKSHNYELGFSYSAPDSLEFKFTSFYSRFDDFINYERDGTLGTFRGRPKSIMRPFNVNKAKTYGAELELGYQINSQFYAHAALAWMKGRIGAAASHGVSLSQAYPKKAILGLDYNYHGTWGAELDWTLVGKGQKPSNPSRQFRTPGYGVLDLTAWWQPLDNLTLTAGVYNAGDKKYWLSSDVNGFATQTRNGEPINLDNFTQPGRHYAFNLRYEF